MVCKKCGAILAEDAKVCDSCGTSQQKPNRTLGIVLLVLGAMSVFGASINGTYAGFASGMELSDIFAVGIQIFMIVFGLYRIFNPKK